MDDTDITIGETWEGKKLLLRFIVVAKREDDLAFFKGVRLFSSPFLMSETSRSRCAVFKDFFDSCFCKNRGVGEGLLQKLQENGTYKKNFQ